MRKKIVVALLAIAGALFCSPVWAQVRSNVLRTGALTSSAVTADQVVLTYTVTAKKELHVHYVSIEGQLTTPSATAAALGSISVEAPSGTKVSTWRLMNPTTSQPDRVVYFLPTDNTRFTAGQVVRVVVTPAAATSTLWQASLTGWER